MPDEQSKVLTLVFTDLADSTALKRKHGDQAVGDLIAQHREQVTRVADESLGRVIDWAGDGCFLTFETSSAGVMFALRLQQAHADDADMPEVRIGLHMGEVTEKEGQLGPDGPPRIEGLAVDLAARIQGLAKPGQVLMSSSVYQSARQRLGVDAFGAPILWQAYGDYSIKGFDDPLDICEAGLEGMSPLQAPEASEKAQPLVPVSSPDVEVMPPGQPGTARKYAVIAMFFAAIIGVTLGTNYIAGLMTNDEVVAPNAAGGPIRSLAVLPLDNLMNDPEQDYFADGMTEAITAELAKIKAIKVISRTSVMQYKDTVKKMPEIASELGVEGIIEGSVLLDGDDVRITVQLIDGRTDAHVWSESYTNTITSVLKLQSDVALAIADAIKAEVTGEERSRIAETRTVDPAAYQYYLQGRQLLDLRLPQSFDRALENFERAIELQPDFAAAHANIAMERVLRVIYYGQAGDPDMSKAREAALRALEIDPKLGTAYTPLAMISLMRDRDWERAEQEHRRAIEFGPVDSQTLHLYAFYLLTVGRIEEALERAREAKEIDPLSPIVNVRLANVLSATGRHEEALEVSNAAYAAQPDLPIVLNQMGGYYLYLGEYETSSGWTKQATERARTLDGRLVFFKCFGMFSLAAAGDFESARELMLELQEEFGEFGPQPVAIAATAKLLGDDRLAYRALEESIRAQDVYLSLSSGLGFLKPFADDPRAREIVASAGLPDIVWTHPVPLTFAKPKGTIEKIAVLPFDNMSSDPEQVYFVDGMTEALIAELAKIKSIKVISRTSVMQYKDTDKSLPEIARELGVDALVEGSVMKAGNDVRITAQLVHGITDEHLWADSYTNTLENVFKLQAEVALAITDEINAVVTPDERARIAVVESTNPEAYELYVRGRDFWSLRTEEGLQQARRLFEQALVLDENFALGHVGLADAYLMLFEYGYHPRDDAYRNAREQIDRALAIDPDLGEAYTSLGMFKMLFDWNSEEAEESYRRGIELNPGHATGHQWYAHFFRTQLRHEEELAQTRAAHELDPVSPIVGIWVAEALASVGRYDEALEMAEGLRTLHPGLARIRSGFFNTLTLAGRFEDALTYYESPMASDDDASQYYMDKAYLLAVTGKDSEARQMLNDFIERADPEEADLLGIASVYTALNERDEALAWIEKGYDIRHAMMKDLLWVSGLRPLYDEPRFQAVIQKLNLPDPRDVN